MGSLMPFTILVIISKGIMPESPRWLMQHDRREEAVDIFSKMYEGVPDSATLVEEMIEEINRSLEEEVSGSKWRIHK